MLFHTHVFLIVSTTLLYLIFGPPFTKVSISEGKLPIHSAFQVPSPLPKFSPGNGGFASGEINLGGLHVRQISSFEKIWAAYEGGHDNLGATFYEPSQIPDGYFMLGSYAQPNNRPFFGWVLVGKDRTKSNTTGLQEALKKPIDYTLVWSSKYSKFKQDGFAYIWFPIAPDGYEAVGHVVTTTQEKPPVDKVRCVRSDLTDDCGLENWIWVEGKSRRGDKFHAYSLRPAQRGYQAQGLSIGTFIFQKRDSDTSMLSLSCLKNKRFDHFSSMPNLGQIEALVQSYSPMVYLHPKEPYLPSSVNWFFANGALLYKKGLGSKPIPIHYNGSNLPQGGLKDGTYWLDLPLDKTENERVKKGYLPSYETYLHVKQMHGGIFTDIAIWLFYPFNGPGKAKFGPIDISLGRIGEHVGDWEHITLRISNFNGMLHKVYFSEHSGGTWVDASLLEFHNGSNKVVVYASLHGHAFYSKPGLVLQGVNYLGMKNDMGKSDMIVDTGARYVIVAADHLKPTIEKPPWLNYARDWGPKITYNLGIVVKIMDTVLVGGYKSVFNSLVNLLPNEVFGEEGPTGPKMKTNWKKDEI